MTAEKPNTATLSKRGATKYDKNPFVSNTALNTKQGVRRISNKTGTKMMVVSENTGEMITADAGFWQAEEVDKTKFVKLYVNGVKAFKELTGAGTKVFEVLYVKVQDSIGKDVIYLHYQDIDQMLIPMSKSTFMRGIKELIEKSFIAESMVGGRYYLNPDYMWNGDRLSFVKEYRKASYENLRGAGRDPLTIDFLEGRTDKELRLNSISCAD
jgi:hypothetical protein